MKNKETRIHRRAKWPWAVLIGLALVALGVAWWTRTPVLPPVIITAELDPAVGTLIEDSLRDVRSAPRSAQAWGKLGSVLMHYEFADQAQFAFIEAERWADGDPRWPYLHGLLLLQGRPDQAVPKLRQAVALAGNRPDMLRLQLAHTLAEQGGTVEAEQQFQALLQAEPSHPLALLGVARMRLSEGHLQECTNLLTRCLASPHTAKAALTLMAQAEHRLGNAAAAERAARQGRGLAEDEPWPDPYWEEALAYRVGAKAMVQDAADWMDQGHLNESIAVLVQVTRDYPEEPEAWYLLGWVFNRAQRNLDAEGALREHLRLSPESPKALSQLGIALIGQKRYEEAAAVLEIAVKLKPTWRELHFNLAYACQQLGRESEAIRHLRQALAVDPGHVQTYTALADLLKRRGERVEARQLLQQAEQLRE